jgi:hypothetical protein
MNVGDGMVSGEQIWSLRLVTINIHLSLNGIAEMQRQLFIYYLLILLQDVCETFFIVGNARTFHGMSHMLLYPAVFTYSNYSTFKHRH